MPSWLPFFMATAAHSALLVDWLIFHEGPLAPFPRGFVRPSNVHLFELPKGGMATLVGGAMAAALKLPEPNSTAIVNRMRHMFHKWPRLVAEYKPAFGAVFAQYLVNYTHWGYSDLDVVLGQLPRFIERSELMDQHIVTYSFGDMEAVYLRGQWTMHQNMPMVNDIWQGCKHLGAGLQNELFNKVAWARRMEAMGKKNYHKRFLSAEGCYSYRAAYTPGLRIKVSNKQFVGLKVESPAVEDVYVLSGAVWLCQRAGGALDVRALQAASPPACDLALPGVHTDEGEARAFRVTREGCGSWMPSEFRMCAAKLKGATRRNLQLSNGEFWSHGYEEAAELSAQGGRCRQGAFFHMQEWKKRWSDSGHNIDPTARFDTFTLSQVTPTLTPTPKPQPSPKPHSHPKSQPCPGLQTLHPSRRMVSTRSRCENCVRPHEGRGARRRCAVDCPLSSFTIDTDMISCARASPR